MEKINKFDLTSEMFNMSATRLLAGSSTNNVTPYPNLHHRELPPANSPQTSKNLKEEQPQNKSLKRGLEYLLEKIKPIDFQERAGLKSGDKMSKDTYKYYAIGELFKISNCCDTAFSLIGGLPHFFNGNHWEEIAPNILPRFLSKVALKMGIREDIADTPLFAKKLVEQYMHSAGIINIDESKKFSVCVQNGTIYVTDKGYRFVEAFNKEDGLRYQLKFPYKKNAICPMFNDFLDTVMPDKKCQEVLAEYLAYSLTSTLKIQKMLVLLGGGDNGKSVIYDIVLELFGSKNVSSYSLSTLTLDGNARFRLSNVRLNYGSEMEGRIAEDQFKRLVTREKIDVKVLYENIDEIENYAKLMYNSNNIAQNMLRSYSMYKRLMPIPMNVIIPSEKQNPRLAEEIIGKELSGIFNWILKGLERIVKQERFTKSELIDNTLSKLIKASDSLKMFIEEEGYTSDLKSKTRKQVFYDQYEKFCDDNDCERYKRPVIREKLRLMGIREGEDNQSQFFHLGKKSI